MGVVECFGDKIDFLNEEVGVVDFFDNKVGVADGRGFGIIRSHTSCLSLINKSCTGMIPLVVIDPLVTISNRSPLVVL